MFEFFTEHYLLFADEYSAEVHQLYANSDKPTVLILTEIKDDLSVKDIRQRLYDLTDLDPSMRQYFTFTVVDNYKWPSFKHWFRLDDDIELAILHNDMKYLYNGPKDGMFPNNGNVLTYLNNFRNNVTFPYLQSDKLKHDPVINGIRYLTGKDFYEYFGSDT